MKKVVLSIMVVCMAVFAIPMIISENLNISGYTVEAATIKISKTSKIMNKGETYTLKVTGTSKKITWSSSNKSVATVSSKGKVTAKKKGTCYIYAKVKGGKTYKCKITVQTPSMSSTSKYMYVGNTYTLKLNGTTQSVTWSSSNTSIATVSKGKVTPKKAGSCYIYAKAGSTKYKCKVTVENPKLSYTSYSLLPSNSVTLKVTGTTKSVTWSSNNTSIATVSSSGKVTAKANERNSYNNS